MHLWWMNVQMNENMNEWINEWMNVWMNDWLNESMCKICMNEWVKFNRKENPVHACTMCERVCVCLCTSECMRYSALCAACCPCLSVYFLSDLQSLSVCLRARVCVFFSFHSKTHCCTNLNKLVCLAYVNDISSTFNWRQHDRSMYIQMNVWCAQEKTLIKKKTQSENGEERNRDRE